MMPSSKPKPSSKFVEPSSLDLDDVVKFQYKNGDTIRGRVRARLSDGAAIRPVDGADLPLVTPRVLVLDEDAYVMERNGVALF